MKEINDFINFLQEDVEQYCADTKENNSQLDERFWSSQDFKRHYDRHVSKTEYTGKLEYVNVQGKDEPRARILFPPMTEKKYGYLENTFLADRNVGDSDDEISDANSIGWVTNKYFGKHTPYVYVKFRKSQIPGPKEEGKIEYIMYEPIKSKVPVRHEMGDYAYSDYPIEDRKTISFGLCDSNDIKAIFPVIDELPLSERQYIKLTESIINEANRQQLLNKSKIGKDYSKKNQAKGKNRYARRTKSAITATVRDYNIIDMDSFFKKDTLMFSIPVLGETDVYLVELELHGVLAEIYKQVMNNKGKLEFKVVLSSLSKVLNFGDVYVGCNCPDAKYRMAYQQTKNNYKAGYKETRPSDKTNPNDNLGAGCKHVLLVLANLSWMYKVASVINNYIKYSREHLQRNYIDYIFPKVFGMPYNRAVQLQLFYSDEECGLLPTDQETINKVIAQGNRGKDLRTGKFVPGNELRFKRSEPEETEENPEQLHLDI